MQIANIIKTRVNTISAQLAKKIHAALMASFILSMILAMWGTHAIGAVTPNAVKWHPGHYLMLMSYGKNSSYYLQNVYNELEAHSALRGVAVRFTWKELEPAKGVYNFSSIDKHLAEVAARNKRLMILLETKSFKPIVMVPDYLKTATYEGGVFPHGTRGSVIQGYNIKLWNTQVRDRLAALIDALGEHLNSHPYFEGLGLQETAMGQPLKPLTTTQTNSYYNNLLSLNQRMRDSFPNTMTFQLTNYPRGILKSFVGGLKEMGAALGAVDIFIQEPGLLFSPTKYSSGGLYTYFPQLAGVIPQLAQVELSNYDNTKHDGTGYRPTVTELFNFGRDKLKVNYILWTRSPDYNDDLLRMLDQQAQKSTPSGGLTSTCPASIASCTTD